MKALIFVLAFTLAGCASVLNQKNEKITVTSEPPGAQVYANGHLLGKTPLQVKLRPKDQRILELRKEGYESRTVSMTSSVGGGWVILDILFGLVPVAIDAATGSWYSFDQDIVSIRLLLLGQAAPQEKTPGSLGIIIAGRRVISVEPNSPADQAGMESGSTILSIDGVELSGNDDSDRNLLYGEPGKKVLIVIDHGQSTETITLHRPNLTQVPTAQPVPRPAPIESVNRGAGSVATVAAPPAKGFIGIDLDKQRVTNVWAGGPAAKGGLKMGDIVIAANGQKLPGDNENDLKLIRGEPKTPLTLSIKRDGIDMTINTVREEDR